jgi:hypothetical protein
MNEGYDCWKDIVFSPIRFKTTVYCPSNMTSKNLQTITSCRVIHSKLARYEQKFLFMMQCFFVSLNEVWCIFRSLMLLKNNIWML